MVVQHTVHHVTRASAVAKPSQLPTASNWSQWSRMASTASRQHAASMSMVGKLIGGAAVTATGFYILSFSNRTMTEAKRDDVKVTTAGKGRADDIRYLDGSITPTLYKDLEDAGNYRARMEDMILQAQCDIVKALEAEDPGASFRVDRYTRPNGEGGGLTTVLQDSEVFEKAGVNTSVIRGTLKPKLAEQMTNDRGKNLGPGPHKFFASGISSVVHPRNPMVPTMHFNYRYFEITAADGTQTWWYGGGADLTPYYLDEADAVLFHKELKNTCDKHNSEFYPAFKKACDDYFLIKHRGERRGVGGVFFDDLDHHVEINGKRAGTDREDIFHFVRDMAATVVPSYLPIVNARKNAAYTDEEREWQLVRRGRYVEFNLVYDRGTKFGLMTPQARIESIFISMPLTARWEYRNEPADDSREGQLLQILRSPKDWV